MTFQVTVSAAAAEKFVVSAKLKMSFASVPVQFQQFTGSDSKGKQTSSPCPQIRTCRLDDIHNSHSNVYCLIKTRWIMFFLLVYYTMIVECFFVWCFVF